MQLKRKRAWRDYKAKKYSLIDRELPDSDQRYDYNVEYVRSEPFSLRIRGHDERDTSPTEYWYTMTFTPREMKILLSRYIRTQKIPGIEKKLWGMLLDLWEKRLERLDRERSTSEQ